MTLQDQNSEIFSFAMRDCNDDGVLIDLAIHLLVHFLPVKTKEMRLTTKVFMDLCHLFVHLIFFPSFCHSKNIPIDLCIFLHHNNPYLL